MNNYESFKKIKAAARKGLEGNYGRCIAVFINLQIISLFTSYFILLIPSGNNPFELIILETANLIITAFLQILQVGSCFFYLKLNCRQPAAITDIYYGFRTGRNQALEVGVVFALVTCICQLPYQIFSYYAEYAGRPTDIRVLFLLMTAGQIVSFLLLIPVMQSFYILLDFPEYTAKQALCLSFLVMRGNYFRYLLFNLSFVPLILLSFFCCGIGLLWVNPYMEASLASFYLDLMKNRNAGQTTVKV